MTEAELRRTALIVPPRGRAVLCVWTAAPGLLAAPFVFWQSAWAGLIFCLVWACVCGAVYARACSLAAALGAHTLTVYAGIVFPVRRVMLRRAVTGVQQLRTPLQRLAGVTTLTLTTPGTTVVLPAVPTHMAGVLVHILTEAAP